MEIQVLQKLIEMAEFSYEHSKRVGAHQEFLSEDREVLTKAKAHLKILNEEALSEGRNDRSG